MNTQNELNAAFQEVTPNYPSQKNTIPSINPHYVRVPYPAPWVNELQDRFDELTSLPQGWDGYAGLPVSFRCARFAANLIERLHVDGVRAPQLVPGSDGTLQFEWHENQIDLEVDVLGPYNVIAYLFDHQTKEESEIELQANITELVKWVSRLARERKSEVQQVKA